MITLIVSLGLAFFPLVSSAQTCKNLELHWSYFGDQKNKSFKLCQKDNHWVSENCQSSCDLLKDLKELSPEQKKLKAYHNPMASLCEKLQGEYRSFTYKDEGKKRQISFCLRGKDMLEDALFMP